MRQIDNYIQEKLYIGKGYKSKSVLDAKAYILFFEEDGYIAWIGVTGGIEALKKKFEKDPTLKDAITDLYALDTDEYDEYFKYAKSKNWSYGRKCAGAVLNYCEKSNFSRMESNEYMYLTEKLYIGKGYNTPEDSAPNLVKNFYLEKFEEYIKLITIIPEDRQYPETIEVRLIINNKKIPTQVLRDSIDEVCEMLEDKKYNYEYAGLGQGFLPTRSSELVQYVTLGKR